MTRVFTVGLGSALVSSLLSCPQMQIEALGPADVSPQTERVRDLAHLCLCFQLKETSSAAVPRTFLVSGKQRSLELQARYMFSKHAWIPCFCHIV